MKLSKTAATLLFILFAYSAVLLWVRGEPEKPEVPALPIFKEAKVDSLIYYKNKALNFERIAIIRNKMVVGMAEEIDSLEAKHMECD